MDLIAQLARELNLKAANVEAAVKLIDEGNTIPFISRYRKEATGGMDDVALRALDERLSYLRNLEQRKEDVILLIGAQGKLTPELEQQIREATQLQRVEDLYKPYRKKRMTRAQKAREAGLEPLANMIIMQASAKGSALDAAATYVNEEAGFDTPEKALAGAADIVAETVAEDPENVADLRAFTQNTADIVVEATAPAEKTPYEPYYNFDEPLRRIDDIVIESSALTGAPTGNAIRLSVVLRNRGTLPLAMPAIELSLTDPAGQLLARRALLPADFAMAGATRAASAETPLQLVLAVDGRRPSGYTVEPFYP